MANYEIIRFDDFRKDPMDKDSTMCHLPSRNADEAAELLAIVGAGRNIGAGAQLDRLGVEMSRVRSQYESAIRGFVRKFNDLRESGIDTEQLADWAVRERMRIAHRIRLNNTVNKSLWFEIRDWSKYGSGGRTPENIKLRHEKLGLKGKDHHMAMVRLATQSAKKISVRGVMGANYIRSGGLVIVVISVPTTAYLLLTTPEDQLETLIYREIGSFSGGWTGVSAGTGICLVFGTGIGGWRLLACGILGGVAGGVTGNYIGNRVFFSRDNKIISSAENTGMIHPSFLKSDPIIE